MGGGEQVYFLSPFFARISFSNKLLQIKAECEVYFMFFIFYPNIHYKNIKGWRLAGQLLDRFRNPTVQYSSLTLVLAFSADLGFKKKNFKCAKFSLHPTSLNNNYIKQDNKYIFWNVIGSNSDPVFC